MPFRHLFRRASTVPATALAGALLAAAACAPPRQAWRPPQPEVLVEVLPAEAVLSVDGRSLGPGGRTVPVADPAHRYAFLAEAPGFGAARAEATGAELAGARLGLVLRPQDFGEARPLDLDDAPALAVAASALERRRLHRQATAYAERALEVAPGLALPHRVLGDAALALGDRKRAAQEYSAYLVASPAASDRSAVEARVSELRGDLTIPGSAPP